MEEKLKNFLDDEKRLTGYPSKRKMKVIALFYLAQKFEKGKTYTEKEVNALLNRWHTFEDPATLRRELYNFRFLNRDEYGKGYILEEVQPELDELMSKFE